MAPGGLATGGASTARRLIQPQEQVSGAAAPSLSGIKLGYVIDVWVCVCVCVCVCASFFYSLG